MCLIRVQLILFPICRVSKSPVSIAAIEGLSPRHSPFMLFAVADVCNSQDVFACLPFADQGDPKNLQYKNI